MLTQADSALALGMPPDRVEPPASADASNPSGGQYPDIPFPTHHMDLSVHVIHLATGHTHYLGGHVPGEEPCTEGGCNPEFGQG